MKKIVINTWERKEHFEFYSIHRSSRTVKHKEPFDFTNGFKTFLYNY